MSNSTIINIQFVECFDVSTIGNIIVKLKNGMTEHVSKRRVSRSYEIFERKREIVMKRVLKNIFKAIAITCLILEILSTIYLGIYTFTAHKYIDEQEVVEMGKNIRPETDEEINKQLGVLVYYLPQFEKLQATGTILAFSILIGTVIGVTMSIDEKSNKKVIVTYFVMYFVILSVLCIYDLLSNQSTKDYMLNNFLGIALEILIPYSVVYIAVILKKKLDNNKKVKIMNEELNNK